MTVEVKICGISSEPALAATIAAGADYFGLVIFPPSPRHLEPTAAAALAGLARARSRIASVALLVDPGDDLVDAVCRIVDPDLVQLHGRETVDRVAAIRARAGRRIIKAVSVAGAADVAAGEAYHAPGTLADIVLFDARPPPDPSALPGGNGLAFDWHMLEGLADRMPFALAGGLTPDNVAAAIRLTGAGLVDVSSGVESRPGEKDPDLIHRFLQAAKTAKHTQ